MQKWRLAMKSFTKEDYLYVSFLCVSFLLGIGAILYRFWLHNFITFPPCLLYEHLGIYCPGCGGTRSVWALLSGDVFLSVYYHPIVLYCVLIIGTYLILQTIDRLRGKKEYTMPFSVSFVYIGIALLLGNWLLRLVLLWLDMPM